MAHSPEEVAVQLPRIINRLIFLEKKSIFQHGGVRLFPSEIHLMQLIADAPGINATEMARRMGVTKGAISQTLTRLEKKRMITKAKDPSAKNELTARFTDAGQQAMAGFDERQASGREQFARYLAALSQADREVVGGFLAEMEHFLSELG